MDSIENFPLQNQPVPEDYYDEWLKLLTRAKEEEQSQREESIIVFRLYDESYAIPTKFFSQITENKAVHQLPNNKGTALKGIVNIDGRLKSCVSLHQLLEATPSTENPPNSAKMIVLEEGKDMWVFPVDELFGVYPLNLSHTKLPPVNVSKLLKGMIPWAEGVSVGLIDDALLFAKLRSMKIDH